MRAHTLALLALAAARPPVDDVLGSAPRGARRVGEFWWRAGRVYADYKLAQASMPLVARAARRRARAAGARAADADAVANALAMTDTGHRLDEAQALLTEHRFHLDGLVEVAHEIVAKRDRA